MRLIFCDSLLDREQVDPDYQKEYERARDAGFVCSLVSYEHLADNNIKEAIKYVKQGANLEQAMYRGWMLKPFLYKQLYYALLEKKVRLINSPEEYVYCHYLPESYPIIEAYTPKTYWLNLAEGFDFSKINQLTDEFGTGSIIVKDYVKSQKHLWEEACFIPDASDKEKVRKVVTRFLELQGTDLNKGLVFRKFEDLEFLTKHSKSGMPLTKEFRLFFFYGELMNVFTYWDQGDYGSTKPDLAMFEDIAKCVNSNFFTMDIAKKQNDEWIIMELGDGQVSGLPDNADISAFYRNIKEFISAF